MAGHIVHELPDGSGLVESFVGHTVASINTFETFEEAETAGWSMLSDHPNLGLVLAEEAGRGETAAQRAAESPFTKYENMSYARLMLEGLKSIRFGRPQWK